ncbi:MAG: META domain-containing protein [Gemmatimonadaceae bacterium]|nr:META domain-containing protein [Gemmatimonadaceae bacterium]
MAPTVDSATTLAVTDRDWELASFGRGAVAPTGSGGRAPTLRLDAASGRAGGFGGCNRYNGPYTMAADSLVFGALAATKMFCHDGDSVERVFFDMLAEVRGWTVSDSTLTLRSAQGAVATFRAR